MAALVLWWFLLSVSVKLLTALPSVTTVAWWVPFTKLITSTCFGCLVVLLITLPWRDVISSRGQS